MKVLIGPANSGKTERILNRVADALVKGERAMLVVPSLSAMGVIERRLASLLTSRNVQTPKQPVVTFPALYDLILIHARKPHRVLHSIERERLLARIISELAHQGKLEYFGATSGRPGLIGAVAGLIDELWQSGITPSRFRQIASARRAKDKDLALIFDAYANALLETSSSDAEGAGAYAFDILNRAVNDQSISHLPAFESLSLVAADGFDFYTRVQTGLLRSLSKLGVEVICSLTYREGSPVHLWQKRTRSRLCDSLTETVECSPCLKSRTDHTVELFMNDEAASNHSLIIKESSDSAFEQSIEIISAPDRQSEVRAIASRVKSLIIEQEYSPDDIAVVCRSLSVYAHHLERVFGECSIPLVIDSVLPLRDNQLVIALKMVMSLSLESFPRRRVIDCLRSPFFDLSALGFDNKSVDDLDRISIEYNVTKGRDQWLGAIRAAREGKKPPRTIEGRSRTNEADTKCDAKYDALETSFRAFLNMVTPHALSRSACAHRVSSLIEDLRVGDRLTNYTGAERDQVALKEFVRLAAIIANDLRADGSETDQFDYVNLWREFYDELERATSVATYERPIPAAKSVVAQEAHQLRPSRYRAVFVMGLIEGEFPAKVGETSPYTRNEREELRRDGIDLPETTTDPGADLMQFYKALSMASSKLYLSYARTDLAGGELIPSYLIEEIAAVAPTNETRIAQTFGRDDRLLSPDITSLDELALRTARALRGASGNIEASFNDSIGVREAMRLLESGLPGWGATRRGVAIEQRRQVESAQPQSDGLIASPELLRRISEAFGPRHLWSASQFNDYGTCPFRFFAKHVLKLAPVDDPDEGFASNQIGNAYHRILEELYRKIKDSDIAVEPATIDEAICLVDELADKVFEDIIERAEVRQGPLWEFEKREIKKRIVKLIQKEAEWNGEHQARPVRFEQKFGIEGNAPLRLQSIDGEILVCGIIDRIDQSDSGYVVIDYKTSKTPIAHRDAIEGRNLQLPIYVLAASRVVCPGEPIDSAYYLHINSRKKGSPLSRAGDGSHSIESVIEQAERIIVEYAGRARRGLYPVAPNNGKCYPSCEFEAMCRIQSIAPAGYNDDLDSNPKSPK